MKEAIGGSGLRPRLAWVGTKSGLAAKACANLLTVKRLNPVSCAASVCVFPSRRYARACVDRPSWSAVLSDLVSPGLVLVIGFEIDCFGARYEPQEF